ncbi:NADAR family protein [Actinomadura hibisca]|uniref:NADAR family protein n=1 Tax=Actinomadura hibisca TaxID=68565 RepID=UPI000833F110|nr:NADAR family protein [Actinomadura hibisca]
MRVADLIKLEEQRQLPEFVLFWGGKQRKGCLSQWWPSPFVLDDVVYPTAEHYMMAEKARLFGDEENLRQVLAADSPGKAKAMGRQVQGFDERTWVEHRYDIVVRGSVAKFGQSDELRGYLLSTGGKILVEASPLDRIWGIGLAEDRPEALTPSQWRGENLLGFALMDARDALK